MHPSVRALNAHKPLINFIGKRSWPSSKHYGSSPFILIHKLIIFGAAEPETQHAHPAAPLELQKSFSEFLKKFEASSSSPSSLSNGGEKSGSNVFGEFWEAPVRFWQPRIREIDLAETEAISVCELWCIQWLAQTLILRALCRAAARHYILRGNTQGELCIYLHFCILHLQSAQHK